MTPKAGAYNATPSMSWLVKKYNIQLSSEEILTRLIARRFVHKVIKPGGGCHYVFSREGLKYGMNVKSPNDSTKSELYFYVDKFVELINNVV